MLVTRAHGTMTMHPRSSPLRRCPRWRGVGSLDSAPDICLPLPRASTKQQLQRSAFGNCCVRRNIADFLLVSWPLIFLVVKACHCSRQKENNTFKMYGVYRQLHIIPFPDRWSRLLRTPVRQRSLRWQYPGIEPSISK